MSLHARLGAAFFVLLVAPVVLLASAVYAAIAPAKPSQSGGPDSPAVRTFVAAQCERLRAEVGAQAVTAAILAEPYSTVGSGDQPWALCGIPPAEVLLPRGTRYASLAARADVRDAGGKLIGYAYAVTPLGDLTGQLAAAAGCEVRVVGLGSAAISAEQPLPLQCDTVAPARGLAWFLVPVGAAGVLVAAALAWWLARVATAPLSHLVGAVDRIVAGDLSARPATSGRDEAARLGAGLDRLVGGMREAQRLSVTDALTGLGNLRQLREALRIEVERANRFGRTFGVLMLDLDHFKEVNDAYGHRAGDEVLIELALRMRRVIREVDLAFRYGGEEFAVLLPETDIAGSLTAARRIGEAVRDAPFHASGRLASAFLGRHGDEVLIAITVSVGVAVYPRHVGIGTDVLDAADMALYAAKAAGRDTFVLAGGPRTGPRPVPGQGGPQPHVRAAPGPLGAGALPLTFGDAPPPPALGSGGLPATGGASISTTSPRSGAGR